VKERSTKLTDHPDATSGWRSIWTRPLFGTKPAQYLSDPREIALAWLRAERESAVADRLVTGCFAGMAFTMIALVSISLFGSLWQAVNRPGAAGTPGLRRAASDWLQVSAFMIAMVALVHVALPRISRWILARSRQWRTVRQPRFRPSARLASIAVLGTTLVILAGLIVADAAAVMISWTPVPLALLWAGLAHRTGDVVVCRRCRYPRPDTNTPDRCPECGNPWLLPMGAVMGVARVNLWLVVAGATAGTISLAAGAVPMSLLLRF
jgi:hypothetical protein